jgi:hypothetical protein
LGVMERLVLSDAAWERMAPLIISRPDQKGSTGRDNRMFVEGVLWIVRTGSNICSTSISMPSAISSNAASQSSSSSAASQPASKRPPEITGPSSLSLPSSYGCDKCPHHLAVRSRPVAKPQPVCSPPQQRDKEASAGGPVDYAGEGLNAREKGCLFA